MAEDGRITLEELKNLVLYLQQTIIKTQSELIDTKSQLEKTTRRCDALEEELHKTRNVVHSQIPKISELEKAESVTPNVTEHSDDFGLSIYELNFIRLSDALKTWTGREEMLVLFDSDIDDQSNVSFQACVLNKHSLFIILFDKKGNIFGAYLRKSVSKVSKRMEDKGHFIFSLESNGRVDSPKRWIPRSDKPSTCFMLNRTNNTIGRLCEIGFPEGFISVSKTSFRQSGCVDLSTKYEGIDNDDLNATNNEIFHFERIMIVQML
ncbi:hypothetical protein EIN_251800 [Entamoeba invadens IP1]|uniref:TLDc domain-containing protein n=1 Tax=Entamoeba invadens IP1 TaxID=370355 RepID=A0A0A1UEI1_ENTIV|nr:hypothetical protein EIN_251800 [Entamoeba invadens IP1]ELP94996.1 hypothetical protein EIN_251800 [Entamoeba invadens IP1]|eukprot:XP_004261767.1 hypothetical protein EIN_251800 [Entamoeba invadens IP1]